ncbi:hypothetical protein [Microcella flavibacter]|uniref:hypothetical protein n=1 Tax=Microcella flavibacter TaxID=1804990 RepID=UPI0014577B9F|nr:hypothetical protein [Microcella flavibacter]
MSDDATPADERRAPEHAGYAHGWTTRSASVRQTLLLAALVATAVIGLAYQLGASETSFDRPGQLLLLFVDLAPVLWFAAAPIILHALRWRAIAERFRWVVVAAVVAAAAALVARLTIGGESLSAALLDPFTVAFIAAIGAAVLWTRVRVTRIAAGDDRGITVVGLALGFAVAALGIALGWLRLLLVGPVVPVGVATEPIGAGSSIPLLIATTFVMVSGLFWLTDRTRRR